MKTTLTLIKAIRQARTIASATNQGSIDLFLCLSNISMNELWRKKSFYVGAEELIEYKDKKFGALMHDIFNRSTTWFRNMDHILQLTNGQQLYLQHGHSNMVAYMGFSPENQIYVLNVAKKRPLASFHSILNSAGLKPKTIISIEDERENTWEKKYKTLEKQHLKLKKENKILQAELDKLTKKQEQVQALLSVA